MTKILAVVGSARKGRAADGVLKTVQKEAALIKSIDLTVADLAVLELPFYNNENSPSSPEYSETNKSVRAWGTLVEEADAVVFLMPEYNHTLSAIQKNAIDWLYNEWQNKPTGVVSYGWYGGSNSLVTLREIAKVIKIDIKTDPAELYFTKDITLDGSVIDEATVSKKIQTVLTSLL